MISQVTEDGVENSYKYSEYYNAFHCLIVSAVKTCGNTADLILGPSGHRNQTAVHKMLNLYGV